jgi:hypothetical protein
VSQAQSAPWTVPKSQCATYRGQSTALRLGQSPVVALFQNSAGPPALDAGPRFKVQAQKKKAKPRVKHGATGMGVAGFDKIPVVARPFQASKKRTSVQDTIAIAIDANVRFNFARLDSDR